MSAPPPKPRPPLPEGPYLVVGLARSGEAAARMLAARGAEVVGCDSGSPEGAARLAEAGLEVHLDTDGVELVDRARCVVKSPGVPGAAPPIARARELGLVVAGELELAWRLLPNRFVAVTGTNGKTTVTELVGHVWRTAAEPVAVAGNVGTPLASLVGAVPGETTIVCECSSFQLEDSEAFAPECAVFLNLAPDHLDRHRDLDHYLRAKLRIFANQDEEDVAVYNADEEALAARQLGGRARRVSFCPSRWTGYGPRNAGPPPGAGRCDAVRLDGDILWRGERLLETSELRLIGSHNVQNAMAAAATALSMGIDAEAVRKGLRSFPGVPHRLERIAERNGVLYVNDSKATNVAAAGVALAAFDGGVHLILGGRAKDEPFTPLSSLVVQRCRACYLIGEAAAQIKVELGAAWGAGVDAHRFENLGEAVSAAAAAARPGEVVLLSPACASYDAYRDFEERGEHFRYLVEALGA